MRGRPERGLEGEGTGLSVGKPEAHPGLDHVFHQEEIVRGSASRDCGYRVEEALVVDPERDPGRPEDGLRRAALLPGHRLVRIERGGPAAEERRGVRHGPDDRGGVIEPLEDPGDRDPRRDGDDEGPALAHRPGRPGDGRAHVLRLDREHHHVARDRRLPVVGGHPHRESLREVPAPFRHGLRHEDGRRRMAALHEPAHQARRHVAPADESDLQGHAPLRAITNGKDYRRFGAPGKGGGRSAPPGPQTRAWTQARGPNTAVPIRTMVAPSATAASRSSVMPMERVSRARPSPRRRSYTSTRGRSTARLPIEPGAGPGNGHQAPEAQPGELGDRRGELRGLVDPHPRLGRFLAHVDLETHVERRQPRRALVAQAPCDAQPVHGLDPVEALRHRPRLVGLKGAHEVPFDAAGPGEPG